MKISDFYKGMLVAFLIMIALGGCMKLAMWGTEAEQWYAGDYNYKEEVTADYDRQIEHAKQRVEELKLKKQKFLEEN